MNAPEPLGANGNLGELELVPVRSLKPAPENDDIYRAIAWNDPAVHELARSIAEHGIQEPILISRDGYIISGHRRRMAAFLAELELVPVRFHPISRAQNPEAFKKLLVEMNTQRIKSTSILLHESLVKIDPETAHQNIVAQREEKDFERRCNYLTSLVSLK
jgi:ParB-like nuclease domain